MPTFSCLLPTRGIVTAPETEDLTTHVRREVVDMASEAEALKFDGVWVGDSVLAKPRLEPLSTLATLAGVTESVTLGTAVYLPALRHPVHVAHQTATIDRFSGGRLALGVGVGGGDGVHREYDQLDVPFRARGAVLDECLDVLNRLWSGESVSIDGICVDLDDATIGFTPGRAPPIYVASKEFDPSKGFPPSIRRRIAEHGDGWLPSAQFSPEAAITLDNYAAGLRRIRSFLADAGREPDEVDPAYYQDVVVADSEQEALDVAREFMLSYYPTVNELTDDQIRTRGVFGPPARVAEHFEQCAAAGVETFVVRFTSRSQHEQLRRFSDLF